MPFAPVPVSTDDLVSYLTEKCGTEVNTKQLFEASEHFNCSLATVKKRLKNYKQGIGKWNLGANESEGAPFKLPGAPFVTAAALMLAGLVTVRRTFAQFPEDATKFADLTQ